MTEDDARPARRAAGSSGTAMSERMQALLSRAAEEQLTEQRQVSAVLTDLRALVHGLGEQLRGTASSARLEGLGSDVASLSAELRRTTASLAERLDELGRRADEQAVATSEVLRAAGGGGEAVAVRLAALGSDVASQGDALDHVRGALQPLEALPDAVAALAQELAGLHDRLGPLPGLRAGVTELVEAGGAVEALRTEVTTLAAQVDALPRAADVARTQEALGSALGERLERLEAAAERPVLTPQRLDEALARTVAQVQEAGEPVAARLDGLDRRLAALEAGLADVGERLSSVRESAGAVPSLAAGVAEVAARVGHLAPVRDDLVALRTEVSHLREDVALPQVVLALGALREDVEDLAGSMAAVDVPAADAVGAAVTSSVTERLVGELAPRVADLVLQRVAHTLVEQVSGSVSASVQNGLTERVRAANADSERRIGAHVDEAVLALAEALLRRRRSGRWGAAVTVGTDPGVVEAAPPAPAPVVGADDDPDVAGDQHPGWPAGS